MEVKGEKVAVTVVQKAGSYTVTADIVIDTQLKGESLVAQLIKGEPATETPNWPCS